MNARGGRSQAWTEPVDELAPQTLAGDERDPIPPVAVVAAHDRRGEKAQHQHRTDGPRHRRRAGTYPHWPADSRPRHPESRLARREAKHSRPGLAGGHAGGRGGFEMTRTLNGLGLATMLAGALLL